MNGWNTGASASQIVPVMLGDNASALRVAAELERNGFAVRAIRPPTVPEGTARLRLSLTSKLTDAEIANLAQAMAGLRPETAQNMAGRGVSVGQS